jgi:signal transduction histidine kinase
MEYFDLTLEAINRLARDMEDVLDFTKPVVLRAEEVRVRDLFDDVAQVMLPRARERGVEFEMVVDARATAPVDEARVRQMLINLVENALQATPSGGRVQMSACAEGEDVLFEVSDTGRGIQRDVIDRIWEPFFTTRPDGTGLGLANVRKTVIAHGGSVEIGSELSRGTTFRVRLPARRSTELSVMVADEASD